MKRIVAICYFALVSMGLYSQTYFEDKAKEIDPYVLLSSYYEGIANFDFSKVAEKTLVIPKYNSASLYNNLMLGSEFQKLEESEKAAYYNRIWEQGLEEVDFKSCGYKISTTDFENRPIEEHQNNLY